MFKLVFDRDSALEVLNRAANSGVYLWRFADSEDFAVDGDVDLETLEAMAWWLKNNKQERYPLPEN